MPRAGVVGTAVFATAPYKADETGVVTPELPSRCVFAGPGEVCSVFIDHRRERKTGPCMAIAVVGCSVHPEQRYTLYPPGHVPYGRKQVVATSVSGPLLRAAETGDALWEATVMSAAVDAAGRERWPAGSPAGDTRRRRTQGRRIERAGRLLGAHPALDEPTRERIAVRLGVPTMTLRTAARSWATSWTTRGAAIVSVLLSLSLHTDLPERILAAGAVAAVWARPYRWEPSRGSWVVGPSEPAERAAFKRRNSRGPPPTNSPGAKAAGVDPHSGR